MTDATKKVEVPAKVKGLVVSYDDECTTEISFKLGDGQTITFAPDAMTAEIQRQAMYHGFNQKIRDAAAGFDLTGKKGKPDYDGAFEAMRQVTETLHEGLWSRKVQPVNPMLKYLPAAIAKMKGVEIEKAMIAVEKVDEETKKKWLANVKVKAIITELIAEEAKVKAEQSEEELDFGLEPETEEESK
jgi:hypothetical protein